MATDGQHRTDAAHAAKVTAVLLVAMVLLTLMQRSSATAFQPVCRRPGGQ